MLYALFKGCHEVNGRLEDPANRQKQDQQQGIRRSGQDSQKDKAVKTGPAAQASTVEAEAQPGKTGPVNSRDVRKRQRETRKPAHD